MLMLASLTIFGLCADAAHAQMPPPAPSNPGQYLNLKSQGAGTPALGSGTTYVVDVGFLTYCPVGSYLYVYAVRDDGVSAGQATGVAPNRPAGMNPPPAPDTNVNMTAPTVTQNRTIVIFVELWSVNHGFLIDRTSSGTVSVVP